MLSFLCVCKRNFDQIKIQNFENILEQKFYTKLDTLNGI